MHAKKREEARQKDLEIFEGDTEFIRYPAGLKACIINRQDPELDDPWTHCLQEDKVIQVKVPKGSSRRKGIEIPYHTYSQVRCKIELDTDKALTEHKRTEAEKVTFVVACEKVVSELKDEELSSALGTSAARSFLALGILRKDVCKNLPGVCQQGCNGKGEDGETQIEDERKERGSRQEAGRNKSC